MLKVLWQSKSAASFPVKDKHGVNKHHIIRKSHDATQWKMGAFHSTKNSGLTFRNFHMSNGTVFTTLPDRSRSVPTWAHFTWQNAEGSWQSSCFKRRKLLHRNKFNRYRIKKSSLIFTSPTQTPFSRDESNLRTFLAVKYAREVCKQSEVNLRKFGTISPYFPENQVIT